MAATNDGRGSPFWPPFKELYDYIEHVKFELGSLPEVSESQEAFVRLYQDWLVKGILGFAPYREGSDQTRKEKLSFPVFQILENGLVEQKGTKDVVIDEKMRAAGKQVGYCLDLDEEQALYLIHVWQEQRNVVTREETETNKRLREEEDVLSDDGHVSMKQLASIAYTYCNERLYLLKSLEEIFWIGEEPTDCPARDFIESFIGDLLKAKPDVEEATIESLGKYTEYRNSQAQKTVIMGRGKDDASYSWAILTVAGREKERATLLSILMFIYYQPRKQCTAQRFLYLFQICRDHVLNVPSGNDHQRNLSDRLAILLLLEILVLDIGKPLRMVAEGHVPTEENYVFLEKNIMNSIHQEMKKFAESNHYLCGPLVLTWASIVIVLGKDLATGNTLVSLLNGNENLSQYGSLVELPGQSKQLHSLIMYHALAILLKAFGLDPDIIDAEKTDIIISMLRTIFQESLVSETFSFNSGDALAEPIVSFFDSCAAFFPACPRYLLDLLSSLCKSYEGSISAVDYLNNIQTATMEYGDLERNDFQNDGMHAVATTDMELGGGIPGVIQAGTRGRYFPAPPGTASWVLDSKKISYICWDVQMGEHQSTSIVLWRLLFGIEHLLNVRTTKFVELISEIESILRFYATAFTSNDLFVIEMLNQRLMRYDARGNAEYIDLLTLLGACVSNLVLARSKVPDVDVYGALALCFQILSFIVPYFPNRVLNALLSGLGISALQLRLSETLPNGSTLPIFDQIMASWASGDEQAYKSVLHLFNLVSGFLQTVYGPTENTVSLALNMTRIAVPYIACRAGGLQKWNLSAACITIVRHSLLVQDTKREDTFALEKEVLRMIYPLLPPNSNHIIHDADHQQEVEAIEKCCIKWLRLVPVLLAGCEKGCESSSQKKFEAGKRFNEEYFFTSVDGVSPSPASTLLSYLSYPYFSSEDKAAAVRSISFLLNFDSNVPITAFLPKDGPRLSLFEPCMVIANAVNSESPTHEDALFCAACDVLSASVLYHPTLAVILLPDIRAGGPESKAAEPFSCTNHILTFAERASDLYHSHPVRLKKILDVMCASITSKTSRNGIITGMISNEKIWTAFMDVLKIASDEEIEVNNTDDLCTESTIHHLAIQMKIMDIFVATGCSAMESITSDTSQWQSIDSAIKPRFAHVVCGLLEKYSYYVKSICIQKEVVRARQLAALAGIQVLAVTCENPEFCESLQYEDDSLMARLYSSIYPSAKLDPESLLASCKSLYQKLMENTHDDALIHSDPFESISDVLLTPMMIGASNASDNVANLDPGCLPIRIGSAWEKLIEEFSYLESQMFFLKKVLQFQESVFESTRSLDSFMAVSMNRYPEVVLHDMDLSHLIDGLNHLISESHSEETLLNLGDDTLMKMAVYISKIAAILSQKLPSYKIDEPSFFHLLTSLADTYIANNDAKSSLQSHVLSNLLMVGIHILDRPAAQMPEFADLCSSLMPKTLHLSCDAMSSIACPAASLCTIMMRFWARPLGWEEHLESFKFMEAFDFIIAQLKKENDVLNPQYTDLAVRTKSLLLLISQIASDSRNNAGILVVKGLCDVLVAICHVLVDVLPNAGYAGTQSKVGDDEDDLSICGRYLENGSRYEMHSVYCVLLSLCSLLWTSLPGHRKVQALLLRVSVLMSERLMLALKVPSWDRLMITLGYAEEGRVTVGFICTLVKLEGEWILNQPAMMSQLRQATAQFLDFAALGLDNSQYAAICGEEVAQFKRQLPDANLSHALGLSSVCINPVDAESTKLGEVSSPTLLSFSIASKMYTTIKYALHFQIISSPEICEAESRTLSDRWVRGDVLQDLTTRVASSLLCMLEQKQSISSVIPQNVYVNLMELCKEIIENAQQLMVTISYSMPRETSEEVQMILKRASLSMQ